MLMTVDKRGALFLRHSRAVIIPVNDPTHDIHTMQKMIRPEYSDIISIR